MSLGAKFVRIVPWATCSIVLTTIVSQVTLLLAFFLPLKVVVLLGSSGMPRYFPDSWQLLDRDMLILFLSAATVVFYLTHLFAENLIGRLTSYGASRLLQRSQKLALFENQEDIATKAYLRYSSALSGAVFGVLAVGVLFWLYPAMALVVPGVVLVFFCLAWGACMASDAMQDFLGDHLSDLASLYSGVGFFLGFAYLVTDFLFFDPPGLIPAIIALLLLRQFFRRTSALAIDISALFKQRHRLDALFFHGHVFVPQEKLSKQRELWQLLEPHERSNWATTVLRETVGGSVERVASGEWLDTGVVDVFALQHQRRYMLKLFSKKRLNWAQHEAYLLSSPAAADLPALRFLSSTSIDDYPCHSFELQGQLRKISRKQAKLQAGKVWVKMVSVMPPSNLVKRYQRSHPSILQRLSEEQLLRLSWVVSDEPKRNLILGLAEKLPMLKTRLAKLPLVFTNPDMQASLYVEGDDDNNVVMAHWGRWGIESVGAMLPLSLRNRAALEHALAQVALSRKDMESVNCDDVLLMANLFALERFMDKQQWQEAANCVPVIQGLLSAGEAT